MIEVIIDDERFQLNSRTEFMVRWLVKRDERINTLSKGRIQFDFGGQSLKPSLQECEELTVLD